MFRTFATAVVVAGAVFLAGAAGATASTVTDQYTEQVPTPGGDKPSSEAPPISDSEGSEEGAGSVTSGTSSGSSDDDGASATAAAEGGNAKTDEGASPATADRSPDVSSGGTDPAPEDSDGMGLFFPLILVGCLGAALVAVVMVRRGRTDSQAT